MPSADVLDFEKLLAPIPGEAPTGGDLRVNAGPTSLYYQVKDGRNAARAAERRIEGGQDDAPPDWKPVVNAASKALSEATKDLELTAYLIEGLCRTHGVAGLRDGFKLARGLAENFWDGLLPAPDEDGLGTTLGPLAGLNGDDAEGTLVAPINRIAITDSGSHGKLTTAIYLQAVAVAKIVDPEARERRISAGSPSMGPHAQLRRAGQRREVRGGVDWPPVLPHADTRRVAARSTRWCRGRRKADSRGEPRAGAARDDTAARRVLRALVLVASPATNSGANRHGQW